MATSPTSQCLSVTLGVLCLFLVKNVLSLNSDDINLSIENYVKIAKAVNTANSSWVADPSLANLSVNIISSLKLDGLSLRYSDDYWSPDLRLRAPLDSGPEPLVELPTSFDLRERYPHCTLIGAIKIQSNCGSCWALATAGALADRMCIATNGRLTHELSVDHLLTCCKYCTAGPDLCTSGGDPIRGWYHIKKEGVPTGGMYDTHTGCKPYRIAPCNYPGYSKCEDPPKLQCTGQRCHNKHFMTPYDDNLYFVKSAYLIRMKNRESPSWRKDLENIMMYEIYEFGSIVAAMTMYEDFKLYKKGVYQHISGKVTGGHAVKLIGWGEENGVPYWLGVNTWSKYWGDSGTFKIRRGVDECLIETFQLSAGRFDSERSSKTVDFVYDTDGDRISSADRPKGLFVIVLGCSIMWVLFNILDTL